MAAYAAVAIAVVGLVAAVAFTIPTATSYPQSDAWAHVAALREWSSDLWSPGHSHLPVDVPSARFVPPYLPLALVGSATGWSGTTLLGISGIAATVVLSLALYAFYRMLLPGHPWAPVIGLLAMMFLWGLALPWSNLLELRSLLEVAGYPSTWALGSGMLMVAAAARYDRAPSTGWLVAVAIASALTFITHPITALFCYVLALVVVVARGLRRWRPPAIAAVLGGAASLLWPFFSVLDVITDPVGNPDAVRLYPQFYGTPQVLALIGPSIIGLYAITRIGAPFGRAFAGGAGAMAALWALNIWVPIPVGDRYLIFAVMFLQMATVAWLVTTPWTPSGRSMLRMTAAVLVAFHLVITGIDLGGTRVNATRTASVFNRGDTGLVNQLTALATVVGPDQIVMADFTTRWMLPAVTGKVVASGRDVFGVDDARARLAAAEEFFFAGTSMTRRIALLAGYDAEYVLFAPEEIEPAVAADLEQLGEVTRTPFFTLVSLR
jgi:hypothetical protein